MKLEKFGVEPILSPNPANEWESLVATNPACWYDDEREQFILIYRAAGHDDRHVVHFGMATSRDGLHFERCSDEPLISPELNHPDGGCMEDPRIVKFGEYYFITYAARPTPPGKYWEGEGRVCRPPEFTEHFPVALRKNLTSTHLLITKDFKEFIRAGRMTDPRTDDRDVIIFPERVGGKFYTIHRPMGWTGAGYGVDHPAMWIAACDDLLEPKQLKLLAKAEFDWECKIGGSTPPLRTDDGWLTLYHAVGPDKHYRTGVMLLDHDDPTNVTHRAKDWIMEPDREWETKGLYNGVAFPCGNVIKDGRLYVYYGGGDIHCGVAVCDAQELLEFVKQFPVT